MLMPTDKRQCSQYFTYGDLISCGSTFHLSSILNVPRQRESWKALSDLAINILDPIRDHFGSLNLTYGFCSPELASARLKLAKSKDILPSIYPPVDQHACYELNAKGKRICERGGAACDFQVPEVSSLQVVLWIVMNLPFDRIYFYGPDKPLHVSYNSEQRCGEVTVMKPKASGRGYVPRTLTAEKFLEHYGDES